jgi:hypothetical protein
MATRLMVFPGGEAEAAQTVGVLLAILQFEVRTTTLRHRTIDLVVLRATVPLVLRCHRPPMLTVQKEVMERCVVALITVAVLVVAGISAVRRVVVISATAPMFFPLATIAGGLDTAWKMPVQVHQPALHVIVRMRRAGAFFTAIADVMCDFSRLPLAV